MAGAHRGQCRVRCWRCQQLCSHTSFRNLLPHHPPHLARLRNVTLLQTTTTLITTPSPSRRRWVRVCGSNCCLQVREQRLSALDMAAHRRSPFLPLSLLRHTQLLGSVDLLHARAIHTINRKGDFELVLSDDGDETMTLRAKVCFFIFGLLYD